MPPHGWVGLGVVATAEALLFRGSTLVGEWFTPVVWTGYVLFADALVARVTGRSFLTTDRAELVGVVLAVALPLAVVSPWLVPLVWVGYVLLLEPINYRWGRASWLRALERGDASLVASLLASGLVCGVLWEFWNYRALAQWTYTVPYFGAVKVFEMPVLGYLGFPPFALECYAMYNFLASVFRSESAQPSVLAGSRSV